MIFKNKKIQKLISCVIIISIFIPSLFFLTLPKQANAQEAPVDAPANIFAAVLKFIGNVFTGSSAASGATVAAKSVADWAKLILTEVLRAVARKVLQELTKSIVSWVNSGFHGSPLFLENSESFFTDIVKTEVKTMVDRYGYDKVKFPYGKDFALNTINSYKATLETNSQYTLSKVIKDQTFLTNYQNNFNVGGWNGFLINTQYPQNNYLGFQMVATDQLANKIQGLAQTAGQKVQTALAQGQGFLSPQICETNQNYNNMTNEFQKPSFSSDDFIDNWKKSNPEPYPADDQNPTPEEIQKHDEWETKFNRDLEAEQAKFNDPKGKNVCPKRKDGSSGLATTTPGYVVGNQVSKALGASQDSTTLAGQAGNALSTILGAVVDHFLNEGLTSLASKVNSQPAPDTWTYGGVGLDGPDGTNNDPFAGFDEIVVLKDFKILLSGYDIGTCSNIKSSDDNKIDDQEDVSKAQCDSESIPTYEIGTCSIKNASGNLLDTRENLTKKTCDLNKKNGNTTTWTKTQTILGNNTVWKKNGDWNKKTTDHIKGDIDNTIEEIALMGNPCDPSDTFCLEDPAKYDSDTKTYVYNPGIMELLPAIQENVESLDKCQPGPDKGWEDRLKMEQVRVSKGLTTEAGGDEDESKIKAANDAIRELKFAIDSFKDWMTTKMISALPQSILYIDEVKKIDNQTQKLKETTDARREKFQTVARLNAIKLGLDGITTALSKKVPPLDEPAPNSSEERTLISLWKQYRSFRASISSTGSIENTRNDRNTLADNNNSLKKLNESCLAERGDDWTPIDQTGKGGSALKSLAGNTITIYRTKVEIDGPDFEDVPNNIQLTTTGSELEQFCQLPVENGYSHGEVIRANDWQTLGDYTFKNLGDDAGTNGYTDLPLVNAQNIVGDVVCTGLCSTPLPFTPAINGTDKRTSIAIDCNTLFKANKVDYKHAGDPAF